jgi:hypothetical protein
VGRYRLSKAAEEDLIGIALFGDAHFGRAQSNRYRDKLGQRFQLWPNSHCTILLSTTSAKHTDAACVGYIRSTIGLMEML